MLGPWEKCTFHSMLIGNLSSELQGSTALLVSYVSQCMSCEILKRAMTPTKSLEDLPSLAAPWFFVKFLSWDWDIGVGIRNLQCSSRNQKSSRNVWQRPRVTALFKGKWKESWPLFSNCSKIQTREKTQSGDPVDLGLVFSPSSIFFCRRLRPSPDGNSLSFCISCICICNFYMKCAFSRL